MSANRLFVDDRRLKASRDCRISGRFRPVRSSGKGVPKPTKAHPVAAGKSSYGALLGPPPASIGSQKWNEFRLGALEQWGSSAAHGDPSDDGLSVPHSEAFFLKVSNIDHRRCLT